ncbi:hypothetical protein TSAR_006596 [Trichomalopsis sarcophagae]|uniref:Exonuclease domain-containing protein n=1 Tax=Trichomalopsis sarcophagae TaxID=543379 RepID=A0A232EQC8_9HYME|nr:hypothetical protein TSAR_006596 [Trichomalopsis sarcophagae]
MSPSKQLTKYCKKTDNYSTRRRHRASTLKFKRQRLFLKKQKSVLRHKNEISEGATYESNISLVDNVNDSIEIACIDENYESIVVFFDLETSSTNGDCDILQIAVKYEAYEFSIYIKPTQLISDKASQINGLTFTNGNLKLHEIIVITVNLQEALAKNSNIQGFEAHDAAGDVAILEQILLKLNITKTQILQCSFAWNEAKEKILVSKKCTSNLKFVMLRF